jgi:cytochrome c peroxidase
MIGRKTALPKRRRRRPYGAALIATVLLGATLVGRASAEAAASPAPKSADGGAVTSDEAKAVAEKRRAETESPAAGAGAQKLGKGPHGAMPVAEQVDQVDRLKLATAAVVPPGVDPVVFAALVPTDNAITPERIALGKRLYFDTRLSKDGTLACATCHDVSRSFTDRRPVSEGIADQLGQRNAPTTMNALFFQTQFLDGRAAMLEDQARLPILNPIEMGQPSQDATVANIKDDAEYQKMFQAAYGRAINYDDLVRAIATFERTFVFLDAPFDAFAAGDHDAISAKAQEGWVLFNGKARCVTCHMLSPSNPIGTDNRFHNIGVSARKQNFEDLADKALKALRGKSDQEAQEAIDRLAIETNLSELGRFLVTRNRSDIGSFKTSQLRNVGITGPYMHDGSMQTLFDVVDHYNRGGEANPFLDGGIEPLALTDDEIEAVVELLGTLTDQRFVAEQRAETARQRAVAAKQRPFRENQLAFRKVLPFEARVMNAAGAPGGGFQTGREGKQ